MVAKQIDRDVLVRNVSSAQHELDEQIRELVLKYGRVDLLAEILGYDVYAHHLKMMLHVARNDNCLILAFRGSGKTTVVTIVNTIYDMIVNPNIRVCIASKSQDAAKLIIREIRDHLEGNENFIRIFGDLVGNVWNETEIVISTRNRAIKEPTVIAVGVGGQIAGKHFERFYGDDLVDEENARTPTRRESLRTWFYKQVHGTFEPTCKVRIIGTRYHFDDLYGLMQKNEMASSTCIIEAIDPYGNSAWPEKYSNEFWIEKQKTLTVIEFDTQFRCRTDSMHGDIFRYEILDFVDPEDVPDSARFYGGVDLAIKEKEDNDEFAVVGIGVTKDRHIYITSSFAQRLRFDQQSKRIVQFWREGADGWTEAGNHPQSMLMQVGIEANHYQHAQVQRLEDAYKNELRLRPITTIKDKTTRAKKLSLHFEQGRVHIVGKQNKLVESLVLFPGGPDDLFDALDMAVTSALYGARKRSDRGSVGVI